MLTPELIREGYQRRYGRDILEKDLVGFYGLMKLFDCEDSESYEEAHDKILASMESRFEENY